MARSASDPHDWQGMAAAQQVARERGWQWRADDPYNWRYINAELTGQVVEGMTGYAPPSAAAAPTTPSQQAEPGVTAPAATPAPAPAAPDRTVFDSVAATLHEAGLDSLFTLSADGTPGGWLWEQITKGVDSAAALGLALEQTDAFKARFPVIGQMRQQAATTAGTYVPSVRDVITYETEVGALLRNAGAPAKMSQDRGYLQGLMGRGLSGQEVESRLGQAFTAVAETPVQVRQAFTEFFGVGADTEALIGMFLDPETTLGELDRMSRTAYTAGMGRSAGLTMDRTISERIAGLPKTQAGIVEDLQRTAQVAQSGILTETFGEGAQDLTQQDAMDATIFGDGAAAGRLERRTIERAANARSSTGGAALTDRGLTGLSST